MSTVKDPRLERTRNPTRMVHLEHPDRPREAWCGADVIGEYTHGKPADCVVCIGLWADVLAGMVG